MPAYEDLVETGGKGSSWLLVAVYMTGFAIAFIAFIVVLAHFMGIL